MEARKALELGLDVMIFSDNVPLSEEIELKKIARQKGLLLMGPDCGTAIRDGCAIGFANVLPRGSVGLVGASGTGIQEISVLLSHFDLGISMAIGAGSRDLSLEVGGLTTLQGIEMLDKDKNTSIMVVVSKPPDQKIADNILHRARRASKPVVLSFLGSEAAYPSANNVYCTADLEGAALITAALAGINEPKIKPDDGYREMCREEASRFTPDQRCLAGLFSGGSLAYEVLGKLIKFRPNISTNVHFPGQEPLNDCGKPVGDIVLDMGDDKFTRGRAHPMIDMDLRCQRLLEEARRPQTAVILMDIVLGYGAHPDPAQELAPAIDMAKKIAAGEGRYLSVLAYICGTELDPQGALRQKEKLVKAGALVTPSNAWLARLALEILNKKEEVKSGQEES